MEHDPVASITREEAARLLGTTSRTVFRMVADGRLTAVETPEGKRVLLASVLSFVDVPRGITQNEAARRLGVDVRTIRRMLDEGRLSSSVTRSGRRGVDPASMLALSDTSGHDRIGQSDILDDTTGHAVEERHDASGRPAPRAGDEEFIRLDGEVRREDSTAVATPRRPSRRMMVIPLAIAAAATSALVLSRHGEHRAATTGAPSVTASAVGVDTPPTAVPTVLPPARVAPVVTTVEVASLPARERDKPPAGSHRVPNKSQPKKTHVTVVRAKPEPRPVDPNLADCLAIYGGEGLCG